MNRMRRDFMIAGFVIFALVTPVLAQERSGTIIFSGESVGVGVGYTWGAGTLAFKGKKYPFTVHGLSVADVGAAQIEGTGDVYNLQRIEDFSGSYVAAAIGATVSDGGSVAVLENQNGVRVNFRSKTQGLKLNISADGVTVRLK